MRRFAVPKNFFGTAGSPLVEDGRVIANIGGKDAGIVAFEARTGAVLWKATSDAASYSSGIAATIDGSRAAIFLTRNSIVVLDPSSGQVKAQQPWRARSASSVNVATPLIIGDLMFVSAEYGPGAGVFKLGGSDPHSIVGVGRCPLDALCDGGRAGRRAVWFPRPPGIRSQSACRRSADRQGALERRSVPRRQYHAGRRAAGDRRESRASSCSPPRRPTRIARWRRRKCCRRRSAPFPRCPTDFSTSGTNRRSSVSNSGERVRAGASQVRCTVRCTGARVRCTVRCTCAVTARCGAREPS